MGRVEIQAAHIMHERNVFFVGGLAPVRSYPAAEPTFSRSIRSFRPLSREEAESVRPNRISLLTARAGDTWQSIAERERGVVKPATLAIMNDHTVNDQPRAGERLKVVVAE
jgi:predicted Zn-dependent protease